MKVPIVCLDGIKSRISHLKLLAVGLLLSAVMPVTAFAQCAGAVDITFPGAVDLNGNGVPDYLLSELPETVNWELTPRSGASSLPIDVDTVRFGLSCFDNGDFVPCTSGNDGQAGNNALTPLQFGTVTGGTCNATVDSNTAGIVTFALGEILLDSTGCTIDFTSSLEDLGIDSTPNFVTPAVAFNGTCSNGALNGSAAGSAAVEIVDPAIEVLKTGPDTAKVGDEFLYEISFTVLSDPEVLGDCRLTDPTLGIDQLVVPDQVYTFPYTPQADDPNPLDNVATVTCDVTDADGNVVTTIDDDDDHTVDLIDPEVVVTKTGPDIVKAGDEITYTISFTATGFGDNLGVCILSDPTLGVSQEALPGQDYVFVYPVPADTTGVSNTATVVCDVLDFDNDAEGADSWDVEVIDPSIVVTKSGPDTIKAGDEIIWTISFTAAGFNGNLGDCLLNDELLNLVNVLVVPGQDYNYPYPVPADATGSVENIAVVTCDVLDFDNDAEDDASWTVDLIGPEVVLTKTGPDVAKAGDEIEYTISFTTAGFEGNLGECILDDPTLGVNEVVVPGQDYVYPYPVPADTTDPVENTATVVCDVLGFDNDAGDEASWIVEVIDPEVVLTKTGPDDIKAGDEITYTISFTATGFGDYLGDCTLDDPTLGVNELVVPGQDYFYPYAVPADAVDPIDNTATVVCDVLDFDNNAEDDASWTVDVINPGVSLTKECRPDPVRVGETIEWAITVENTGNVELDCVVNDPTAGIVDEPVVVAVDGTEVLNAGREVVDDDGDVISNTATVVCPLPDFDNQVDDEASADCEVERGGLLCRTPGFWKVRAGDEKGGRNITGEVIDSATPPGLMVCGAYVDSPEDAMQAMCGKMADGSIRQLVRQLTAGMLNCRLGVCTAYETTLLDSCNAACAGGNEAEFQGCINQIDCFNNGGDWDGAQCIYGSGQCAVTEEACSDVDPCPALPDGLPQACVPDPTCHDEGNLCEDGAEFCFEPVGRNSSPKECQDLGRDGLWFPEDAPGYPNP